MAEKKLVLSFNTRERKLWCKETKERDSVECVLVAELPDEKKILYASTVGSEELDRRYGENSLGQITDIAVEKKEGKKQLWITWKDGKEELLDGQDFVLLFVVKGERLEKEVQDSLLVINFPRKLASGIFKKYFPEDQEDEGLKLFWLLKDMI